MARKYGVPPHHWGDRGQRPAIVLSIDSQDKDRSCDFIAFHDAQPARRTTTSHGERVRQAEALAFGQDATGNQGRGHPGSAPAPRVSRATALPNGLSPAASPETLGKLVAFTSDRLHPGRDVMDSDPFDPWGSAGKQLARESSRSSRAGNGARHESQPTNCFRYRKAPMASHDDRYWGQSFDRRRGCGMA